jgi:hypothetical protein
VQTTVFCMKHLVEHWDLSLYKWLSTGHFNSFIFLVGGLVWLHAISTCCHKTWNWGITKCFIQNTVVCTVGSRKGGLKPTLKFGPQCLDQINLWTITCINLISPCPICAMCK